MVGLWMRSLISGSFWKVSMVRAPSLLIPRCWSPPDVGWIKANFDAFLGVDGCRGLGVVFRNHDGRPVLAAVRRVFSHMGVEEAELSAACFAVEVALRMGFDHIHLESDAEAVTTTIKKELNGLSPLFSLYSSMYDLCSNFEGFYCSVVRRSGNTVAHYVAHWDTGSSLEKICMEPFSPGFMALIDLDLI